MSASRPHDGERFDDDDAFDPWPIADKDPSIPFGDADEEIDRPERPDLDKLDPDERVERTRQHMVDGNPDSTAFWNSEEGEAFLRRMDAIEHGPFVSAFRLLLRDGVALPSPESISEEDISCAVWAVIGGLAARRIFLSHTDHLSDRELYEKLWFDVLRAGVPEFTPDINSAWHFDMVDDDDPKLHDMLTYYADDDFRAQIGGDDPNFVLPPKQPLPFDRDQYLPASDDARRAAAEDATEEPEG